MLFPFASIVAVALAEDTNNPRFLAQKEDCIVAIKSFKKSKINYKQLNYKATYTILNKELKKKPFKAVRDIDAKFFLDVVEDVSISPKEDDIEIELTRETRRGKKSKTTTFTLQKPCSNCNGEQVAQSTDEKHEIFYHCQKDMSPEEKEMYASRLANPSGR